MIYVTADLHGIHPDRLQKLLNKAGFSRKDFLFVLGDVIDRGEYGAELLSWLTQQPNMQLVLGNHEAQLLSCSFLFADVTEENLSALTVENMTLLQNWITNGGNPTMKGFRKLLKEDPEVVEGVLEYLQECPLYEEVIAGGKEYVLVHAGLGENFSPEKLRFTPGAIFLPIRAASIGIVPEPENGSANIRFSCQKLSITRPAATVSRRGAILDCLLYPLL